ncbi:protease III [Salmonella enterica subsp. enterica]|uniref:Protease III n=1 Tax=Salmonella enterica I TaxID=59201 RepID=A0A447TW68_SALET|nr:protease III [Salmonella enterica subsp. enterica]
MMRSVNAPQHLVQSVIVIGRPLGGLQFRRISVWQPLQETIRKSDKDTRQYQAIRLDNDMVVLLVSDPQAVKSLSALVVPVGSLEDPEAHQGLAHYLEHMCLMGSKKISAGG